MLDCFVTKRMVLRPLEDKHIPLIFPLNNDPDVMRYIGNGAVYDLEKTTKWVNHWVPDREGLGIWSAFEKKSGDFIGLFMLVYLDKTLHVEIGYRLMKNQWGKGYATEGAQRLLRYGFGELQLEEIVAVTIPENKASRHVLEKIGLCYQKDAFYYNCKVAYYSLSNSKNVNIQTSVPNNSA